MAAPLRVLVVDGSEEDAARTLDELRRCDYDPSATRVDTLEGLNAELDREGCDLVVTDHGAGSLGVEDVLAALRGRGLDVPVIVVAASLPLAEVVRVIRAGAHEYLSKGELGRLGEAVGRELHQAQQRRAHAQMESRRRAGSEVYRRLLEEIPALTYVSWADDVASPVYVSPQIQHMLGVTPAEWLADRESWVKSLHPEDRDGVLAEFRRCRDSGEPFRMEYRVVARSGEVLWWRDEGRALYESEGGGAFVRGLVMDVTERRRAEQALRYVTDHDPLSGLPNRNLLLRRLGQALSDARRDGSKVALLLVRLERLHEVANTLGREHAEMLVRELARRLGDVLGEADRLARLAGAQFAVLLPGADANLGQRVASKMLDSIAQPVVVEKLPIEVGAQIGISVGPDHSQDPAGLLRHADVALQAARRESAACKVYSASHDPYDPENLRLLGELRHAIEGQQLLLHYQPKLDLKARVVTGAEALVRWQHPKRGLLHPNQFIPLAERGGLIKPLTWWVLVQAVRQCTLWNGAPHALSIAVNLSARNLQDQQLPEQIGVLLEDARVAPERLQLELTESAVMADPVRAVGVLSALAASGVRSTIDDFGTGYTSLSYLTKLPVSELKIDKSFVLGMSAHNQDAKAIVRSTNDLGHHLGLSVVAEGVEDARTLDLIGSIGCDAAQGFYIARPMSPPDFETWLGTTRWRAQPSGGTT